MITKKDLSDQILNKKRADEFLFCENCEGRYSANVGDYFLMSDDMPLICSCGGLMALARETRKLQFIKV